MKQVLSNRWLEGLAASSKRVVYTDQNEKNLLVFIEPTGKIYWYWQGRVGGTVRQARLGQFPAMDVNKARREAGKLTAARDEAKMRGETWEVPRIMKARPTTPRLSPAIEVPQPASGGKDLNWLWDEYLLRDGGGKASTVNTKKKMYDLDIRQRLGDKPYAEITYNDLTDLIRDKAQTSPGAANNMVAYVKRLFRWATTAGYPFTNLETNPAERLVKLSATNEGDRHLAEDEIVLFFKTVDALPGSFSDGLIQLLYTGVRLHEGFDMPWTEYSAETGYWDIPGPRTKNGDPLLLPLPPTVQEMLKARKEITGKGVYVFPQRGADKPVAGFSRANDKFRAKMDEIAGREVAHWTPHDLRRTVETGMTSLLDENKRALIPMNVIDKILNHRQGKVRRTYNKHEFLDEKERALLIWATHLDKLRAKARQPAMKQAA